MNQNVTIYKFEVRRRYYESGALYSEAPYENGERHGIEKGYYESGALRYEIPYIDGSRHGIEKGYYGSGALGWDTPYVNGKAHGISRGYDEGKTGIAYLTLYDKSREVASVQI